MKVSWPSLLQQYGDGQTVLWFWRMIFIFLKRKIWILGLSYTERATPSHERLCICTKVSWARFPLSVAFVSNQNNYILFGKCLISLVDLLTENSFWLKLGIYSVTGISWILNGYSIACGYCYWFNTYWN